MKKFLIALAALMFAPAAYAADVNWPVKAAPAPASCVTSASCSGWYVDFAVMGEGNNVNVAASGLNAAFHDGLGILGGGGYQIWQGQVLAGLQVNVGYEFASGGVSQGGGKFLGTELIQLGYNFFPNAGSAATAPGQSPSPMVSPAALFAASTPYFNLGGIQRHGISEAAFGAGIQTVIAAGWSSAFDYINAPSQKGQPDTQIFMLKAMKHF